MAVNYFTLLSNTYLKYYRDAFFLVFNYRPNKFNFLKTDLKSFPLLISVLVGYLTIIYAVQYLMKSSSRPFKLKYLIALYNLALSVGSLLVLIGMFFNLVPKWTGRGFFYSVCNKQAYDTELASFMYLNYLFKFVELFDTLFLVLRKKPLSFLHVYHHAMTAVLVYEHLYKSTICSWFIVFLNLIVHVFMYYYYFLAGLGYKVWWKKYLTSLQIIQFILDISLTYFLTGYKFFYPKSCQLDFHQGYFANFLLTSYLVLFIQFYLENYKSKPKSE